MKVRSLRSWLLLSHGLTLVLAIVALLGTGLLAWDLRMQTKGELIAQGEVLALWVGSELEAGHTLSSPELQVRLEEAAKRTRSRVRLLDPQGVVRLASTGPTGEDLSALPEVQRALAGSHGTTVRPSDAGRGPYRADEEVFQAIPLFSAGELQGVLLLQRSPRGALQALYHMRPKLAWSLLFAVLASSVVAIFAARLASQSLGELTKTATHLAEGDFEAAQALSTDSRVEEVARLSQAMERLSTRLEDRLAYIGEFAGHVSHEFKTPLATLRGTVELLADDPDMPAEQRTRFLDNAQAELLRLDRLVTGLLRLARAEERMERAPVDLDALLERVGARHGLSVQGSAGTVQGSQAQLEAALENLVHNAQEHGAAPISIVAGPGWFGVEDAGPGISAANQARAFERFFTTRRDQGGTGLGLALVQTIALAHGGDVELESAPGRTLVKVVLG
ncbi:MAG: ATP-binding protein [Myxococcota bacterium]|nr:ATP-binding protein [Myxococcota bacterium]